MSITIHFRGQLRTPSDLPAIVHSVEQMANRLGWPYQIVDERIVGVGERCSMEDIDTGDDIDTTVYSVVEEPLDDYWQGIVVWPPKCETLFLTFNRQGKLIAYGRAAESPDNLGRYGINEYLFCKTQFGPIEAHIGVCNMLRLVEPYASEWAVSDEGGYWETGDVAALEAKHEQMDALLQRLSDPKAMQELLDQAGVDVNVTRPPEVGKVITGEPPAWRRGWGDEHSEN